MLEYSILAGSTVTSARSPVAETAKQVRNGFSFMFIGAFDLCFIRGDCYVVGVNSRMPRQPFLEGE